MPKKYPNFLLLFVVSFSILFSACGSKIDTYEIRSSLDAGNLEYLSQELLEDYEEYHDFSSALNSARMAQLEGRWADSISLFNEALFILEEYEDRAIINVREMASSAGELVFARGSTGYYGTGYERSLLHTFNSINYLMLGDFEGAAVEMRNMEVRQELWLEESETRLQGAVANYSSNMGVDGIYTSDGLYLPDDFQMADILKDESLQALVSTYQDAFSYSFSSIVAELAGDTQRADISKKRAILLHPQAKVLFAEKEKILRQSANTLSATANTMMSMGESASDQNIMVIIFGGLSPALFIDQTRVLSPFYGYAMIDLPAFLPARRSHMPELNRLEGISDKTHAAANFYNLAKTPLPVYHLLQIELLAYHNYRDEFAREMRLSFSRAISRLAVAVGVDVAMSTNNQTKSYAELAGFMTNLVLDLMATHSNKKIRNWEMLPNDAYLAYATVKRGGLISVELDNAIEYLSLPYGANNGIFIVTQINQRQLRVDYVEY